MMATLVHRNLHIIAFFVFAFGIVTLQFGPSSRGWPIALKADPVNASIWASFAYGTIRLLINSIPAMLVLSLCMMPFGYNNQRSLSISSLLMLMLAASICLILVPRSHFEQYNNVLDHALLYFLTTMAINGILFRMWSLIRANIELPQWTNGINADNCDQ